MDVWTVSECNIYGASAYVRFVEKIIYLYLVFYEKNIRIKLMLSWA